MQESAKGKAALVTTYNTTANEVAHKMLLSGRTPNKQPKERFDRQRCPDDPEFAGQFNAAEFEAGINAWTVRSSGVALCCEFLY